MARQIPESELEAIEAVVRDHADGVTSEEIEKALKSKIPRRTFQHRLKHLVSRGRLVKEGSGRWTRYLSPGTSPAKEAATERHGDLFVPLSKAGVKIEAYVSQPVQKRKPTGYNRKFLDSYRPNVSAYLSPKERAHLHQVGKAQMDGQPAGTYAKQILNRLLIDLSWNSSRLEGNTYSLLDTKRLIEFGEEAEGKNRLEAQMILNHKEAIEFLVTSAKEVGYNRYTILNLHGLLANNLLPDADAPGRLRRMLVGIGGSVFEPLGIPRLIEECFDQILDTAAAIKDPYEQTLFAMVQFPYLQPFDDVNKRVSRLAANIPLIKNNLSPLSFADVPRATYTQAVLGVYELNKIDLLKDVFIWAYERSATRYTAVRQSLGEPDPFRLKHRSAIKELIGEVVRNRLNKRAAVTRIAAWAKQHIPKGERKKFVEVAESELIALHEGNFARYQIRPSEFAAWQRVWTKRTG
jgi:Fic family protein